MARRIARWLTPTAFALGVLCFLLPFATVSCAPGGYGRANPAGTTTYTGVDLVTGSAPEVDPEHLRTAGERRDDRLDPQPLAILAAAVLFAGIASAAVRDARLRRGLAAAAAGVAAVVLVTNQAVTEALLQTRLTEQLSAPMPADKSATDYVHTGNGFGLSLALAVGVTVANLVGWWRAPASRLPLARPPQGDPEQAERQEEDHRAA